MLFNITSLWASAQTHLALMLDYDGTLTPIVDNPNLAIMSETHLNLIRQLSMHPRIHLAIVSGRSVNQLRPFLSSLFDTPLLLCGMHGGEVYNPAADQFLKSIDVPLYRSHIQAFQAELNSVFKADQWQQGLRIESKEVSITLHYRQAEAALKQSACDIFTALYHADSSLVNLFRIQVGKEVLEIVPKAFNKGEGVAFLAQYWGNVAPLTLCYVGDDLTDEAAFSHVNAQEGISVCIGKALSTTEARYTLPSVTALYEQLDTLLTYDATRQA